MMCYNRHMNIQLKRAYDEVSPNDGYRALVDRLWPRGVKKENLHLDKWYKDIGPSTELRVWFGHEPEKFPGFKDKYLAELASSELPKQLLLDAKNSSTLTLIYSAKDTEHNQAVVLAEYLKSLK